MLTRPVEEWKCFAQGYSPDIPALLITYRPVVRLLQEGFSGRAQEEIVRGTF